MTGPTGGENAMSSDVPVGRVEVVVQFTARCNEDAHRLLAKHYFALKLHACVQVCGDLFIVVMERVHGEVVWEVESRCEVLPSCIFQDVRDVVALLHSKGLVFGDLRTPNVMVVAGRPGAGLDGPRHIPFDSDCAERHNLDRYPAVSLNEGLPGWATSGARRCGKADDLAMLEELLQREED